MLNPLDNLTGFFFITHIDNLESILEKGILSHNDVAKQNLKIQDISNQSVQERRKKNYKFKKIVGNDRTLHDYTNLYWNPNNSMMSYLICNKQMYHDIVILDINASKLISSEKWIISDGNAASSTTNFYDKNSLNVKIVSEIIKSCREATSEFTEENKRRMCAEFLYPNKVPIENIIKISCPTNTAKKKVEKILEKTGKNKLYMTEPNRFFMYKKFGSGQRRMFGKIALYQGDSFSASADAIVVSTNTIGVMADPKKVLQGKGGLAGTYRLRCPIGYAYFKKLCNEAVIKMGNPAVVNFYDFAPVSDITSIDNNDLFHRYHIFFPTKIRPSRYENSTIEGIKEGLIDLIKKLSVLEISSLSMPALGCGLGNLSFDDEVLPLIIHYGNKFVNSKGEKIFTYLFMPQNLTEKAEKKILSFDNEKYINKYP